MQKMMFSDKYGLTEAVLDGRKTQTRRIITCPRKYKGQNVAGFHIYKRQSDGFISEICLYDEDERDIDEAQILPKFKIGEIVAVAQSYETISNSISETPSVESAEFYCKLMKVCYPIEGIPRDKVDIAGWNNKMFVKPELMLHQIRLTNIRVERIQDISDEDCLEEGILKWDAGQKDIPFYTYKNAAKNDYDTPREAYAALIDKISGKGTWDKNPYVWAYSFKLVK